MSIKITYFGHEVTEDNIRNLASGHADVPLSEIGVKQAKRLHHKNSFDIVFTSDLRRAVDTAKLAFPQCKIIRDKRLRECDYGQFTQKVKNWQLDAFIFDHYPGGESYKNVEKRMANFLEFLRKNYDGKHIAIVSHHAPQLALDVLLKSKTWKQAIDEDRSQKKNYKLRWDYVLE